MQRVFCLLCFLFAFVVPCAAEPYSHSGEIRPENKYPFLAQLLAARSEITFCVALPDGEDEYLNTAHLSLMTQAALREWTLGITLRIRAAGRAEEMRDILQILEKPLRFKRLPACDLTKHSLFPSVYPAFDPAGEKTDLTIVVSSKYCSRLRGQPNSFFVFDYGQATPFICLMRDYVNPARSPRAGDYFPGLESSGEGWSLSAEDKRLVLNPKLIFAQIAAGRYDSALQTQLWHLNRLFEYDGHSYFSILAHELGHAFGLDDEYLPRRPQHYASLTPGEGLMFNGYQPISCDEVDGMITLLDRFSGQNRTFSSFCPGRGIIKHGTETSPAAGKTAAVLAGQLRPLLRR